MYCSKCGNECDENTSFCSRCGNQIGVTDGQTAAGVTVNNGKKAGMPKKKIIIIASVALSALVVIIAVVLLLTKNGGGNRSPEELAKTFVNASCELNAKDMVSCYPDFKVKELARSLGASGDSRAEVAKELQKAADSSGERKRKAEDISVEIDREYGENSDILARYGIDRYERENITKVLELDVTYKTQGDKNYIEIICFEEDGYWYILDID